MKRGMVLTLCALAMAASASVANAQLGATAVAVSLNLRYTNPANPAQGGTWYLVAKTGSTDGIAGVSAWLTNINTVGVVGGNGGTANAAFGYPVAVSNATIGNISNAGVPYNGTFLGIINLVYGQDTAAGPVVLDVGGGGGGNIASDPLKNTTWDNASLLASGTFGASRPVFSTTAGSITDANILPVGFNGTVPANNSLDAATTTVVRGDSERSLLVEGVLTKGLYAGDADRNGVVNSSDLSLLLANFNGNNKTWDQGNFNNVAATPDLLVNSSDLSLLLANFNKTQVPVAAIAIPEPSSALLAAGALAALFARRRRLAVVNR